MWQWVGIEGESFNRLEVTAAGEMLTQSVTRSIDPATSLDAATATGPGAALDAGQVIGGATVMVATTGSPTSFDVTLETSVDGLVWFDTGAAITVSGTAANTEVRGRFYRANLTALTGGTDPTVTALLAATHT
jgi:hypothetical protein